MEVVPEENEAMLQMAMADAARDVEESRATNTKKNYKPKQKEFIVCFISPLPLPFSAYSLALTNLLEMVYGRQMLRRRRYRYGREDRCIPAAKSDQPKAPQDDEEGQEPRR